MSNKPSNGGYVSLVGAGPGDPELLTLRALKALQMAQVVLFDDLIARPILNLIPAGTQCICVGKRCGKPSWRQEDINSLMVRLALSGRRVVRLKSGDPSVFGRSGEEIAALQIAGIDVSVIPGITTASALAANLQISLTHRACARSVRFVTAHSAQGGLPPDLDWDSLADPATTLIVYMGRKTGPNLARHLLKAGRSPATPVILAENVSWSNETFSFSTLQELALDCFGRHGHGPLTIAIGDVLADVQSHAFRAMPGTIGSLSQAGGSGT